MDFEELRALLTRPDLIWAVTLGTIAMAIASLAAVPLLVVKLPTHYFVAERPGLLTRLRAAGPLTALWLIVKNVLGLALAMLGVAMLVLPGQGVLTLLLALVLLDLPRKHLLERRLVARPAVRKALDAVRRRFDRPPFDLPSA